MLDFSSGDDDPSGETVARLTDYSILITGGGSGIGRSVALLSAHAGARVTVADLNEEQARKVVEQIRRSGGQAQAIKCNVSSEEDVAAAVRLAVGSFGKLDGACNAAGAVFKGALTHEIPTEYWDFASGVNLRGTFLSMKHEISAMLEIGGGSIVNIASTAAVAAFPYGADYVATKTAIAGLTRAAALDYAERKIRVNAILPGSTRTPMLAAGLGSMDEQTQQQTLNRVPMKRLAFPIEIALPTCWLLSNEARFVTGVLLPVDGGLTASL